MGNSADDIMVKVGPLCVDKYEASVWNAAGTTQFGAAADDYLGGFPDTGNWTTQLFAVSKAGVTPSRFITWFQAQQACALSGKRLLTNAEWQMAAAGTPDSTACNVSGALANTGSFTGCVSNHGVNDMVGNPWEWVADWIQGSNSPWAPSTATTNATYGSDWMFGTNPAISQGGGLNFPSALIRGGSFSSGPAAGVFALLADSGPSVSAFSIGFRCAR